MASGTIKNSKLKRKRLIVRVDEMTQHNYYYSFAVTQDHDYVMGMVDGWGGSASPFFGSYDPSAKDLYFVFGATVPSQVLCDLYYYE